MIPILVGDIRERVKDEMRILEKFRFQSFIMITKDIILPVFYRDGNSVLLIVTPPEYEMKVMRFINERNKPGGPLSEVNCYVQYNYLVKHWR